jgi:hypothetical protein
MKQKTFRLPKSKKVTVDDLLTESEVNRVLGQTVKEKANIESLVIIQQDKDGGIRWRVTGFTPFELIGLLEQIKFWELEDDFAGD